MQPQRVALVTGGTRGIGLGIAEQLARSGFHLALTGRREKESCTEVLATLRGLGVQAYYFQSDVSVTTQHAGLLDSIEEKLGEIHVLVNNAGIAPRVRADILDATPASFDELVAINLRGPYFLTQQVALRMKRTFNAATDRRCIINVGSISAIVASPNRGDYCITKAGVGMATQLWAVRLAEFGIDVFELRPGLIATDMTSGVRGRYDDLIESGLLLEKRWGTPLDVGKAAAMLARNEMSYATGSVLTIDGGLTRQRL